MDNSQKSVLQEAKNIRAKYERKKEGTETKIETLRRLDNSAETSGKIAALTLGVVSTLVLGFGMCCTMLWADRLFALGVIIGILGLAGIAVAYPLYSCITKKQRARIADKVMQLADEIIGNQC